ncbi:hypothetical protein ACRTEV_20485 [Rossellomorea arthrocnemi]
MRDINQTIGSIYISLTSKLDKREIQKKANRLLKDKRKRYVDDDLYIDILISNIAFNTETTRAIHTTIEKLIQESQFPDFEGINKAMEVAQDYIESEMEVLKEQYAKVMLTAKNNKEKISILEQLFSSSMIEQDLTFLFIKAFGEKSNRELFRSILQAPSKQVVELVTKYSSFHTMLLLDSVSFEEKKIVN